MPKKKRFYQNKAFWTWFILIIFILSTLGIVMNYRTSDTAKPKTYNRYKFFPTNNGFMAIINGKQLFFSHFPADLETIPSNYELKLETEKIYFVYNPQDNLNFDSNMNKLGNIVYSLNIRPVKACSNETDCPDIPIVGCDEEVPQFLFKESNITRISQDQNCVVLEAGSQLEAEKLVERIYYRILGIMK